MYRIRVNEDKSYNEIHAVHELCCTIDYSTIKQFYKHITWTITSNTANIHNSIDPWHVGKRDVHASGM